MALVLAAVAPFVFLIGMVARQHRFNERANAEDAALHQASNLADRLDSRFGAVETLLLTLVHSVSPHPVIFRSRASEKWFGQNVSRTPLFAASRAKNSGTAAIRGLDGIDIFSGFARDAA
jgi:hypothetical protein